MPSRFWRVYNAAYQRGTFPLMAGGGARDERQEAGPGTGRDLVRLRR